MSLILLFVAWVIIGVSEGANLRSMTDEELLTLYGYPRDIHSLVSWRETKKKRVSFFVKRREV